MGGAEATPCEPAGSVDARGMKSDSITCPRCKKTSYHPEDIRQGYCGICHEWTSVPESDLGRMVTGPTEGTYIVTIELPKDTRRDVWAAFLNAFSNAAHAHIPGSYVHGHRVMPARGKHVSSLDIRDESEHE